MTLTESYRLAPAADSKAEGRRGYTAADVPALVGEYSPLLFRVAHSVVRSRAEAEDVVQDTFVRVLQQGGKLAAVLDMRVWLVRIAWNLALDRQRRRRPEQMVEVFAQSLVARDLPADRMLEETRRMQAVLAEIDRLPRDAGQTADAWLGGCCWKHSASGCGSGDRSGQMIWLGAHNDRSRRSYRGSNPL